MWPARPRDYDYYDDDDDDDDDDDYNVCLLR